MLLHNEYRDAGEYELSFEPQVASGVYFVRMIAGSTTLSRKIVLPK
jgi:hypothetical protein